MRPLQLSFSGIRSYPGDVGPLDFTGKTLIAILGDTGAGQVHHPRSDHPGPVRQLHLDRPRAQGADGRRRRPDDRGLHLRPRRAALAGPPRLPRQHHPVQPPAAEPRHRRAHRQQEGRSTSKIEALLQLDFDSFITAVLLPQGKFDRLLTATGRERTALLKGIFGVQAIETMRDRASSHRDQLAELIHQAELARARPAGRPRRCCAGSR